MVAVDSARLFAAVRAAKARNFELELELVDARKKVHTGALSAQSVQDLVGNSCRVQVVMRLDPGVGCRA